MPRKEIIYQGLADFVVAIDDFTPDSPDYFRIVGLPREFASGINIFKFKGRPELFSENTEIFIEILDVNGEPIYYEAGLNLESTEQEAIVSVYVNEDTPPGNGLIVLCSTLAQDIDGTPLDSSIINLRWTAPIYIDSTKINSSEIVFSALPEVTIFPGVSTYTNFGFPGGNKVATTQYDYLTYYYVNNTPVLITSSLTTTGFDSSSFSATIQIPYTYLSNTTPTLITTVDSSSIFETSIIGFNGYGIAFLAEPISFEKSTDYGRFQPVAGIVSASITYEQSASLASTTTENSFNYVTAYFTGLQPQVGVVAKIRSYYRSAGVGEYIFSNETDVTRLASELGFTPNVITASFAVNTVHRNDRLDFKFEFINPVGIASAQVIESLGNLFLGGNTYIGGDDNLLTGSLFVAGATGTGVHISGKGSAAMVRSIGYSGFSNATTGAGQAGFVLYSGSIQPLLGSAESYGGVGLELVANSESYFRYKTDNGGLLDIRTNQFFLGSSASFISASNGQLSIHSDNFELTPEGHVTASAVLVVKEVGTTQRVMIDTNKSILDATNIGRTLYYDPNPTSVGPFSGAGTQITPLYEVPFHGLVNENRYVLAYQLLNASGNNTAGTSTIQLIVNIKAINSGSYANAYYTNGDIVDTLTGPGLSNTGGTGVEEQFAFTEDQSFVIALTGSNDVYQGKLLRFSVSMSISNSTARSTSGIIKNFTVLGTRGIASAFRQAVSNVAVQNPDPIE